VFSGSIPRAAVAQNEDNTQVTFDTGYTISAQEAFGVDDTRQLGVAFAWVKIQPGISAYK
jgi:hypothetical protein